MTPPLKVPTDEAEMNAFAEKYNEYVAALREGRIDLQAWKRCAKAWERMTT